MARHRTYTNFRTQEIRTPNGDINATQSLIYTNSVWRVLSFIERRRVGRICLQAIQAAGRTMEFMPYELPRPSSSNPSERPVPNATASPVSMEDATPAGQHSLYCGGDRTGQVMYHYQMRFTNLQFDAYDGTGRGSNVIVRFSPQHWHRTSDARLDGENLVILAPRNVHRSFSRRGGTEDEILLHEMLHGLRQMQGLMHCDALGRNYDTFEEYFAIVVTNMYISERNNSITNLRADHHGFAQLENPISFATDPFNVPLLRRIESEHSHLVNRLRPLNVPFNPFRDLAEEAAASRRASTQTHHAPE